MIAILTLLVRTQNCGCHHLISSGLSINPCQSDIRQKEECNEDCVNSALGHACKRELPIHVSCVDSWDVMKGLMSLLSAALDCTLQCVSHVCLVFG